LHTDQSNFELDIERIKNAEDLRTCIMMKNIPNKYNQNELINEIRNHKGKYNFLYLPIDFKNQANMGYAFVNFLHPLYILDFYKEFHRRRWTKFNSPKICEIYYGRIDNLDDLKKHFKSSSVINQHVSKAGLLIAIFRMRA